MAGLLHYEEAKTLLETVRARDTTDPEIAYYLGIAYDALGDERQARTSFEEAERFQSFHAAGSLRLAEMLSRAGDSPAAIKHLKEAHLAAPDDVRAVEDLVAVENAAGKKREAHALALQEVALFPTSYFLQEELGEPDVRQLGNDAIRVLNLAAYYMRLGFYDHALRVLVRDYPLPRSDETEPLALAPAKNPMIAYFRGYCRQKLGQSAIADYDDAAQLPTAYVFPSNAEELTVLHAATQTNPRDATAHYLLGTLYFSRGLTDSALVDGHRPASSTQVFRYFTRVLALRCCTKRAIQPVHFPPFKMDLKAMRPTSRSYLGADQALSILRESASGRRDS